MFNFLFGNLLRKSNVSNVVFHMCNYSNVFSSASIVSTQISI